MQLQNNYIVNDVTYLKLYQDIEGTHQVIDEFMTIETAEREDIAGHI